MTAKIKCRECWHCIEIGPRDWCKYYERYQTSNKEKTRCAGYESRRDVIDDMIQAGEV